MGEVKPKGLQQVDTSSIQAFEEPVKKIHDTSDVNFFLTSKAYTDIVTFLLQLNAHCFPRKNTDPGAHVQTWELGTQAVPPTPVTDQLRELVTELKEYIKQSPPDPGPRRFGNVAYRQWFELVKVNADALFEKYLPTLQVDSGLGAHKELKAYFLGSFGSAQRLDYGTGHELSFLAFLAALCKLGGIGSLDSEGMQERAIVLRVIEPYLNLIRDLIKTYTLEPAGSHGVWGLDDHFFLPYVFGSAQLGPAITAVTDIPQEGSLGDAPDPGDVVKTSAVERERKTNMYFAAIGFIYDVKKGPFWEHSPMLYDISGIRAGWAKINKGMIKMYIAEVLSKFPVVQHFPFGQVFKWERDPHATLPSNPSQTSNMQQSSASANPSSRIPPQTEGLTRAPWASNPGASPATGLPRPGNPRSDRVPAAPSTDNIAPTRAPWASNP